MKLYIYDKKIVPVHIRIIGNSVKIGDGPAAVNGDERFMLSLPFFKRWEDKVIRSIRKSEDLPE